LNQGGKPVIKRKMFEQIEYQSSRAVRRENGDTLSAIILKNHGLWNRCHKRVRDRYSGKWNGFDNEGVRGSERAIAKAKI